MSKFVSTQFSWHAIVTRWNVSKKRTSALWYTSTIAFQRNVVQFNLEAFSGKFPVDVEISQRGSPARSEKPPIFREVLNMRNFCIA